ncbi:retrovirus-related pol polyprotein from transposon TNT 1-94 [Tanacetum coccineum]
MSPATTPSHFTTNPVTTTALITSLSRRSLPLSHHRPTIPVTTNAEKPLYEGCPDFTKLSAIVKLLNLKGKIRKPSDKCSSSECTSMIKKMQPAALTGRFKGCVVCGKDTNCVRLSASSKQSYAPIPKTGEQIYNEVKHIENKWGKGKRINNNASENQEDTRGRGGKIQKQKRNTTEEEGSSSQVNRQNVEKNVLKEIILQELDKMQAELVVTLLEGCIAEETISEETIEFFSEYHKFMETIGIPPEKHETDENEEGKPLSVGKSSEVYVKLFQKAHFYVIQNTDEFVQYIEYKVRHISIRVILALTACKDYELEQLDVKTTFLHGNLEEVIYMRQPSGDEQGNKVCLLKKSLYGLKQSPRQGYKRFDEYMLSNGFKHSSYDNCVYYRCYAPGEYIYLLLYVDDMLISCKSKAEIGSNKSLLKKKFDMKELREAKKILGMEIVTDRSCKIIRVSQSGYVSNILNNFRIDNGKSVQMPLGGHFKLSLKDYLVRDCDVERMSKVLYANSVGSLMFLMVCTRQDIVYAVSGVSRYLANPGFVDSDYAKDLDKDAEYMTLTEAVKEAIWLRTKHINVRYHFIREVLEAKTVKVLKLGTEHNAADALTKVVSELKLQHCLELLNVGVERIVLTLDSSDDSKGVSIKGPSITSITKERTSIASLSKEPILKELLAWYRYDIVEDYLPVAKKPILKVILKSHNPIKGCVLGLANAEI